MNKTRIRKSLASALLLSTSICTSAFAQSNANASTVDSADEKRATIYTDEIVVTAQKRQQTLSDVPISVTALTGQQLVDRGIDDVEDLMKVTPGLTFQQTGRGSPVISIRGIGFFEQATGSRPTVSVYVDEAPIPFSIEARSAAFDLERVEVLKGPQGTLFGQSSTGGAINFITAKPTSDFRGNLTASYSRFDTAEVQGFVSGPISSTLNARLAVRTVQGGDWQRSYRRDDTIGKRAFTQARLSFEWEPTDRLKVSLMGTGFRERSDPMIPQFVAITNLRPNQFAQFAALVNFPTAPAEPRAAEWDPNLNFRRKDDFVQGVLRADYELSDAATITSLTSYSQMDVFSLQSDGTSVGNFDVRDQGDLETFSQELRISGDVGNLHYLIGGNYQADKTFQQLDTLTRLATAAAFLGDGGAVRASQDFTTLAAFADLTYNIGDRLRVNGGIRYTRQDLDYNACLTTTKAASAAQYTGVLNQIRAGRGLGPLTPLTVGQCASLDSNLQPGAAIGNLTEDNISWRFGVDFKPISGTLLYANVSKGYKGGSIPTPGASVIDQFRPVQQESVLAYEAGFKSSLFDRIVELNAAVFYYDYQDKQLLGRNRFNPDIFGPQAVLVNIPESRVIGGEAELKVRPTQGMTLGFAATYLDTKVKSDFANFSLFDTPINFQGRPFPITPKWQIVFNGEYRLPISSNLEGVFGFDGNYRTATQSGFGDEPLNGIQSYWLLDLRAGVEDPDGKWKVQVFGRNVMNEYYWTSVIAGSNSIRRYVGMPATYGVQFSVNF